MAAPGRRRRVRGDLVTSDHLDVPADVARRHALADHTLDETDDDPAAVAERARLETVQAYLKRSRDRWRTSDTATSDLRKQMRLEQKFASGGGNQWESTDKTFRKNEGRPCLEINRIPQFIRQVSNQQRANRSQIQINPRGKGASVKTAGAMQGLIRSVEVDSDADVAYDTASEHQLRTGLGYVRLRVKWAADDGFERVCSIDRIRNPLSVYYDPTVQEADFKDARFCHIIGSIGKDEYEERWGDVASYQSLTEYVQHDATALDWMPEGRVILAEYYEVRVEKKRLIELADGTTLYEERLGEWTKAFQIANPGVVLPAIRQSRMVDARVVRWCLHNAVDILEGNADRTAGRELPGTRIPVFPVVGDELDLDGKVDYRGMVRDAIDPQRMYNFWTSAIAEAIALTSKAPWIAATGQIEQYLDDWKEANRKAFSVLLYDPRTVDGQIVPPPQRNVAEPAIQGMVLGLKEADQDLKAVMGLFEASMGERGPQQSAKAINAVQQQGLIANSNYSDNVQRTKRALGRCLLEWFPVVYDTARLVHLVSPDGKRQAAMVHAGPEQAPSQEDLPPDVTEVFDLSVGHYEVTVSTGPSFQTERQETEAWLLELFKVLPGLAAVGADIVLENSDNPAAQQLAKRAKLLLPPQVQDQNDPSTAVPRLTAQAAQQQQLLQQQHAIISALSDKVKTLTLGADTKIRVALIQAMAQMDVVMAKIGSDTNKATFQAEFDRLTQIVDHLSSMTAQDADHDHALEQQTTAAALAPPPADAASGSGASA